ncbi:MAG TPA: NTP transferase domain-containing protein [Acidimicrobiales bacterium]|nr:NTP transferase domain-containing protein [Acidimicrobiales bacterium]
MSRPVLVILAAGRARRYGGVKPLAPVGPSGEAVIDLLASDALAAGFGTLVLVIGPSTGPAIRYHVEQTWPGTVDVRFAMQEAPLGTVDATLAAVPHLDDGGPFGVANADDLYGEAGLAQLAGHLAAVGSNCLVAYRLRNAVVGDSPVTRGVCRVDPDGLLVSVDERRQVGATGDGRFVARDGRSPEDLDGDELVSMNLWGFGSDMRSVFRAAMAEAASASGTGPSPDAEVLLPELVGRLLAGDRPQGLSAGPFRVLRADGRCIGVTHPDDLTLVQGELAGQVAQGARPAQLWGAVP